MRNQTSVRIPEGTVVKEEDSDQCEKIEAPSISDPVTYEKFCQRLVTGQMIYYLEFIFLTFS